MCFFYRVTYQKDADGMVSSVDPDSDSLKEQLIWVHCLPKPVSKTLGSLQYIGLYTSLTQLDLDFISRRYYKDNDELVLDVAPYMKALEVFFYSKKWFQYLFKEDTFNWHCKSFMRYAMFLRSSIFLTIGGLSQ